MKPKKCRTCSELFVPKFKTTEVFCSMSCAKAGIKVSEKKPKIPICKGTSIAIGHGCGTPQQDRINGLGIKCKCYSKWLLGTPEGSAKLKRITLSVTAPRIELEKAFDDKKNRTKLNTLLINVRNSCHEFIRLRDKGKPCISCGISYLPDFHAGHLYKAELYSNLKFDEKNINGQCQSCNLRKEGNESGYRTGVIQRLGIEHLNYLDEKAKAYKKNDYHWDRAELEEMRKYYQEKLKELK